MANRIELPVVVLNDQSPYNPVEGATATVLNRRDSSEATVYSDSGATNNVVTQPLTTDESGRLSGWVDRGAYAIEIVIPGRTPYSEDLDAAPGSDGAVTTAWLADAAVTEVKINSAIKDASTGTPSLRTLGTGSTQAAAGNDSRLSNARTPLDDSVTTAKIVDGAVSKAKLGADASGIVPPGGMIAFGGSSAPTGWLLCDGSAVSRTTYASLFAAIGTTHGEGDRSTTFNVPDSRGSVLVGVDGAAGRMSSNDALGNRGGKATHTLTAAELAQHQHDISDPGHGHTINASYFNGGANSVGIGTYLPALVIGGSQVGAFSSGTGVSVGNIKSVSPGQAHNNLQPYLVINHIIKT